MILHIFVLYYKLNTNPWLWMFNCKRLLERKTGKFFSPFFIT